MGREGLIKRDVFAIDEEGGLIADKEGDWWIKEKILEINERKRIVVIDHADERIQDTFLSILAIKDIDIDSKPIVIGNYPDEGAELEMYSYSFLDNFWDVFFALINNNDIFKMKDKNGNIIDISDGRNYPFGKRFCQAGQFDAERQVVFNSCLIAPSFTLFGGLFGTPIVDSNTKRLVAMYVKHEGVGEDIFNRIAVAIPMQEIGDLGIEGYAVNSDDKIATTWSNIKKQVLHK